MAGAQPRRRRRRGRLRPVLLLLAPLLAVGAAWPRVKAHPVFRVEVIHLAKCPDHLRASANQTLRPLLGQTFFDAASQAGGLRRKLSALPEVAGATLTCRPPNVVEVRLTPRVPTLAVRAAQSWLQVDNHGVIVRATARPPAQLPQVFGLRPAVSLPGAQIQAVELGTVAECVAACTKVLGAAPRTVAFETGGALRLRVADGSLVLLGQPLDLEQKLQTYQVIRNRLTAPVRHIDVSMPAAPAWLPADYVPEPVSTATDGTLSETAPPAR